MLALGQREGLRGKYSYLLSVIGDQQAQFEDRAAAFYRLFADADQLGQILSQDEWGPLKLIFSGIVDDLSHRATTVKNFLPSDWDVSQEHIDGKFVQRLMVSPRGQPGCEQKLMTLDLEPGKIHRLELEYTVPDSEFSTLELREPTKGTNYETVALPRGYTAKVSQEVDMRALDEARSVDVYVCNGSLAAPLMVYSLSHTSEPALNNLGTLLKKLGQLVKEKQSLPEATVFRPITGEPLTLRDIDNLRSLQNKFSGERIFIMGNGPSLNKMDLEKLKNDYVFGMNRVSLLFDRVSWRPTFFTAFDVRVVPDNQEEFENIDIPFKFFSARYKKLLGEKPNHYWYHTKGFYEGFSAGFDENAPYSGFGGGGTISIIALELAFFMGFREIYLIGTDVSYSVPKTAKQSGEDVFGDGIKLNLESSEDDDSNHFDPRYFGKGKKWHNPNVRDMKIGFSRAARYIGESGGRLLNATAGGDLNEVERISFDSLF